MYYGSSGDPCKPHSNKYHCQHKQILVRAVCARSTTWQPDTLAAALAFKLHSSVTIWGAFDHEAFCEPLLFESDRAGAGFLQMVL